MNNVFIKAFLAFISILMAMMATVRILDDEPGAGLFWLAISGIASYILVVM